MATLDRERWRRLDRLLDAALDLAPDERARYLREACRNDPTLLSEAQELLAASDAPAAFLSLPAAECAARLVAETGADPMSPPESAIAGRTIGPYRLVRELGEGGMGVVYLAERVDGEFEQTVAFKIARQGLQSAQARRRFLQERQILANLQHEGIARLLDGGVTPEGSPYFVMERVNGRAITEYCRDRRLGIDAVLRLFLQVCAAVQYAHRNLVVHQDLKPSNILVDGDGHVALLDFGIAKLLDDHASTAAPTQLRALTPEYAAPEQLRGDAISTSTDVYALGVLLCELLVGARPYKVDDGSRFALERAILEGDPLAPSSLASSVELRRALGGDLDRIVLHAVHKSPDRRYPSAEALAGDVRRYLDGLPLVARGGTLAYRARKFLRRHRVVASAAALIVVSLAGGLVATLTQMRRAQREAAQSLATQRFLTSIFAASAPAAAQGRPPTARDLLDRGAERIDRELRGQPEVRARLQSILGRIYGQLGEYGRAVPLLESALSGAEASGDRREQADILDMLALATYQRSEFERALAFGRRGLDAARTASGPDSVQAARLSNDVAWVLRRLGQFAEAERLRRFTLDVYSRRLGVDAADTIAVQNDLGVLLADIGQFAEAERLERGVLEANRRRLGPEHPNALNAAYQLARVLVEFGKPLEASQLLRATIPVQKRVLGERHDVVAMSLRMLAWALDDMGEFADAGQRTQEALAIQTATLGPRDAQIAVTLRRRAEIEGHLRQFAEAERDARESLAILAERFGDDNYDVGATRHVLASVLLAEGRVAEAAAQAEAALASRRRFLGSDHPHVADTMDLLGDIDLVRADRAAARSLHEQALRIERARLGDDHPATRRTRDHLAAFDRS